MNFAYRIWKNLNVIETLKWEEKLQIDNQTNKIGKNSAD